MTRTFSALQQRCAAVAFLGMAMGLLWMGLIDPIAQYFRHSAYERHADLDSLSRDRALLSQDADIQATLTAITKNPRWTRFYETQKSDKAVLQLETDLREVFKAPNNPTSMTALPVTIEGSLTRLAARVTLSLNIDQLTESLERLRSHAQLLQLVNFTIQAPDYQMPDSNPTLSIQAEIVGFMVTPTDGGPT